MSILSSLKELLTRPLWQVGISPVLTPDTVLGQSPEQLFRSQANLRTVVDFQARNVAQLGLQFFERVSDTDRRRVTDDPLIKLLKRPNGRMTGYELLDDLVHSLALHDVAFWLLAEDADSESGWVINPIPATWVVGQSGGDLFAPGTYIVDPGNGARTEIPADQMLVFHGWNPSDPTLGVSRVEALKDILAEQVEAWVFRRQLWKRGGRVGAYLTRPKDAPSWDKESRDRFSSGWKEFQASGAKAGSTPVLEDGMEMKRVGFTAHEEEWSSVAKLSLATVAQVFQINPVMVGLLEGATLANTREFRKMLYSETLGPLLSFIADRINAFLVPRISKLPDGYVEFNIASKLQGDFEEQASVLSTSTGAPWMTVNEARARQNLPALEGGDDLVVPLNVIKGGQASPQDGGDPLAGAVEDVAGPSADDLAKLVTAAGVLIRAGFEPEAALEAVGIPAIEHSGMVPVTVRDAEEGHNTEAAKSLIALVSDSKQRQDRIIASRMGAGAEVDWARWERELTADLVVRAGVNQSTAAAFAHDVVIAKRQELA